MADGVVISCHTVDQWNEKFNEHLGDGKLVVVDFTASWCGPCRIMAPILVELAKKFTHVVFLKVDVDELETVAQDNNVEAMPTFILFKNGKEVDKLVGAKKDGLISLVEKHATATATAAATVSA